jgi:hypothetical protein
MTGLLSNFRKPAFLKRVTKWLPSFKLALKRPPFFKLIIKRPAFAKAFAEAIIFAGANLVVTSKSSLDILIASSAVLVGIALYLYAEKHKEKP